MNKVEIKELQLGDDLVELPYPVKIVPYSDNSGTILSGTHTDVVNLTKIMIELIKEFNRRLK